MATVTIGAGWALGARFRYVSGRPSFAFAAVFDSLAGAPGGAVLTGQERNPDTHQLDLRVEKTWTRPWGTLSLHLEVVNVYNRRNADFFRADPDRTLTVPAGPYLPLVPNLGVRGVF
jgi:hypothetical protein